MLMDSQELWRQTAQAVQTRPRQISLWSRPPQAAGIVGLARPILTLIDYRRPMFMDGECIWMANICGLGVVRIANNSGRRMIMNSLQLILDNE